MVATKGKSQVAPKKPRKTAVSKKKVAQSAPELQKKPTPRRRTPKPRTNVKFKPDDAQKSIVMLAAALGYDHGRICELIINPETNRPISQKTLREYFGHQLAHGHELVMMKIAGTLVSVATDKRHKNCVTAGIYLSKVWGRWREPEPEWAQKKREDAANKGDDDEVGDIVIEAELVLEEPKPEQKALPAPQ